MAKLDKFAQIAFEGYSRDKEELQGIDPVRYTKKYLDESKNCASVIKEQDYMQNLQAFREELNILRQRYQPFMRDFSPECGFYRKMWMQDEFQFRYETAEDRNDFSRVSCGAGQWEKACVPDYRGPVGRWTGFYRREFVINHIHNIGKRIFIKFLGVDYIAKVYLNGRHIGSHEGFFASFEFDVTDVVQYNEKNVLVIEVINDAIPLGLASWDKNQELDGDKLYASTGPGWDDAQVGWHHCPPGAGIYNQVMIEERADLFIKDIFVKPDVDNSRIEVWIDVENTRYANSQFQMKMSVYSKNFQGYEVENIPCNVKPAGPGSNEYRFRVDLEDARLWTPENPWLYKVRVSLYEGDTLLDEQAQQFGMRKFHMDETKELKGSLYLNNEPVILRGSNDMGHMQLCVMKGDMDQLIDDILIAKNAGMNYYRFTQRPVQQEIYTYCDMLGMMNQTDLPLFGYLRRNQFNEGMRQAGEMERVIRSHPSAVMVTYINEPFSVVQTEKGHRHLFRSELEDFFEGATRVVRLNNPDRVIKNVEGDYDTPTRWGLSDFHCYNMWYTNHTLPISKLHKGYLPPLKRGWKIGCGEYSGGEGLDNLSAMLQYYPEEWLSEDINSPWTPEKIVKSQTYSMHGDWYEEQKTIRDWVYESQRHQCEGTRLMTDALRRRSDRVISTAIHLLIDAWPSGWMKSLVDHTRTPKPAYFEYKKALQPVRINLRTDRYRVYGGETGEVDVWLLNDTPLSLKGYTVRITLRDECKDYISYEGEANALPASPAYGGTVKFTLPFLKQRGSIYLDAALINPKEEIVNQERLCLEVFAGKVDSTAKEVMYLGPGNNPVIDVLKIIAVSYHPDSHRPEVLMVDSVGAYEQEKNKILAWVKEGTRLVLMDGSTEAIRIGDLEIPVKEVNGLTFLARNGEHETTREFYSRDFTYPYNSKEDEISFMTTRIMECDSITPLVYTYEKPGFFDSAAGKKRKLPAAGCMDYGKGCIYISLLPTDGFVGCNPVLDQFYLNLLE